MLGVFHTPWTELESILKFLLQMNSQGSGFRSFLEAQKQGLLGDRIVGELYHSEARWWSRWEVMNQVLEGYPDVEGFLQSSCDNLSPATVKKFLLIQ